MVFYILAPHRIEAIEHGLVDFLADDVMFAIQSAEVKIATDTLSLDNLNKAYPTYYQYKIKVDKL